MTTPLSKAAIPGNRKVPHWCLSITSATDCPSRGTDLCQAGESCYALRTEKRRPNVLAARRDRERFWDAHGAAAIAEAIMSQQAKARSPERKRRILRFNVSGDFRDQADVDKMATIAHTLTRNRWLVYGYTSRTNLDLRGLVNVATVNVSNDKHDPPPQVNRFRMVRKATSELVCNGNCRHCSMCLVAEGRTIEVVKH